MKELFQCNIIEEKPKTHIGIYSGKVYLSEERLRKAYEEGRNNFQTDYLKYFYFARTHWNNES